MKIFGRVILWVIGGLTALAALAAVALAILVARIDVRAEIERAAEAATGRELTLSGSVGVSYWPVLGLHAAGATLSNVEGGRAPAFLTADDIHVGVELRPLLNRQVVVRELVLQRPRIALEVDEQGTPNWILAPKATPRPPGAPPVQPRPDSTPSAPAVDVERTSLRAVRVTDGEVSFYDARRAAGWVISEVDLSTALESLAAPMHLVGDVRYNDRPVALDIEIGRPGAALRGEATALKLNIKSELLDARFDGQTVGASGELAGAITASGPSFRQLAAWSSAPLQGGVGFEAFDVTGRLAIGGGRYDFSNAIVSLDRMHGRGDFVLAQHSGKPYLSGRLQLADFDLNPYLAGTAPPAETESAETRNAPNAQIAAVEAPARALDVKVAPASTPVDFSGLKSFNADLELITAAVLVQHMRIDGAHLNLVLNDGSMAATLHTVQLYGGSGRGRFEIDAREAAPRIAEDLAFSGIDVRNFLSDAVNFANIEGRGELSLNLSMQGRTQQELIASANGRMHIEVVSGVLHGVDLGGVSRTIRNALRGELISTDAVTPFQGFSATFAVADGVLASDDLSFNTPDLRIPGIGAIDLGQRRLDVRLSARSPRGGISVPFSVRGPWTEFAYRYDGNGRDQAEILTRVRAAEAAARAGR